MADIQSFLDGRSSYIVEYMKNGLGLTGTLAPVTVEISDTAAGSVVLNTIEPVFDENGRWRGEYFTDYPVTVTALVFKFMFAEGNGIINTILMNLHLIDKPVGWLLQGNTAMWGLIIANSWVGIPFNMLLLTTGLNDIPADIYEAASIDGASGLQKFMKITIPLLKPTIMSVLVLGFVLTFKVFDLVYVMTGGGPVDATEVLSTFSYKLSFQLFHFGEGAAVANILFVCLFLVALVYLKTISKDEVM